MLLRSAADWNMRVAGQLTVLALWIALFTAGSYLPCLPHGGFHLSIPAATTSLLSVLWQVQATSVGLLLALVVFVFGLLPQGRSRMTYREFLRRTWALPLTTFNVASLLFNGMVLLGVGHQVPGGGTAPGSGWAVTMASAIALVSTGTIVVILACTLRAINPETEADVQRTYRNTAVAMAARDELFEDMSLQVMNDKNWPLTFSPAYPGAGLTISVAGPSQGIVHDVLVWKLRLLKHVASCRHRPLSPVVRAWPGRPASTGTPLVTIDASSGWPERWWARQCIRLRTARPDQLGNALTALHSETLEDIRAGRPTEAKEGMRALGRLQELLWQAYEAHGRTYGTISGTIVRYGRGVGEQIDGQLDDLLRAAAVSTDSAIQQEASDLPFIMAREALSAEVPSAVQKNLRSLAGVYVAITGELTDGGQRDLPVTGLARSRLDSPFRSLLSFMNFQLAQAIDQAAAGGTTGWDGRPLPSAEFLLAALRSANEAMLRMLRHAIQYRDSPTVLRVLPAWRMPDLPLARNAIEQTASANGTLVSDTGTATPAQDLARSLDNAETDLNAMLLRLLVTALDSDRAARRKASQPALQPPEGAPADSVDGVAAPDPVADAILARLPDGRLWQTLDRAIQTADGDWTWQLNADEDEITPAGAVIARPINTLSPLMEAFALAAVVRPSLVGQTNTGQRLAFDRGPALIAAVDHALSGQLPWLLRHGCTRDTAAGNASDLKRRLEEAVQKATRELEEKIRKSPVRHQAADEVRQAALTAFRERDITGALFDRVGKTVAGAEPRPTQLVFNAPRSDFTTVENGEWALESHGRRLGSGLAALALEQLMHVAAQAGEQRTVRREDVAIAVRSAILELSDGPTAGTGQSPPATRIVALIPDLSYVDKNGLQIERDSQGDGLAAASSKVIQELGISDEGLAAQVAGTIDGIPVIETIVRDKRVVIIDLARFGKLRRGRPSGTAPAEPELRLFEPDDPLRPPDASTSTEPALAGSNQPNLLEVQISLSLEAGITVDDPSAVRVVGIEGPATVHLASPVVARTALACEWDPGVGGTRVAVSMGQ
jgi:hypothetical protein